MSFLVAKPAPDFTATAVMPDNTFKADFKLSDYRGKYVVLYFYPLDFTFICPTEIAEFGKRARDGKLSIADMQGGTFTISNGGVYGSLMSTPILNPPQSGVLGMHRIEERPVVVDGKIIGRPMMYLALSYDHRLVDGKEAVTFLVRVKEALEDPERLLLDL